VLLVLFLIVQACMAVAPAGDSSGQNSPALTTAPPSGAVGPPSSAGTTASAPPASGDLPAASGGGSVADPELCTDEEVLVTAEASRTTFPVADAGANPVTFTIRIAHNADRTCRRDVGGSLRDLYLVRGNGAERVWSSRDCANPTGNEVVELAEGWEQEFFINFTGLESSRCDGPEADGPQLPPGEYTLYASLGSARSEPVTITLR